MSLFLQAMHLFSVGGECSMLRFVLQKCHFLLFQVIGNAKLKVVKGLRVKEVSFIEQLNMDWNMSLYYSHLSTDSC